VINKDNLCEILILTKVVIRPFNKKAITILIMTGSNTFPKNIINKNENTNKIAK
tara:strand:+ start:119 stop:280 length:162 start_codon:yes stop_codon:yes gene_type:complete